MYNRLPHHLKSRDCKEKGHVEEESTVVYEVFTVDSSLPEDSTRPGVNLAGSKTQEAKCRLL
jgi:hypothetical protein